MTERSLGPTAPVPAEVTDRWRGLLASDRLAAEELYFEQILPPLLEALETAPAHRALRDQRYHTLISLMGFSPETTVICAAILRPEALVVVLSKNADAAFDRAHAFLTSRRILRPSQIEKVSIPPADPRAIYAEIRHVLLRDPDAGSAARKRIFDVTGGKKIMSATAGQVAWEADWPLCYVESGAYDPGLRRPVPGREELIVLPSPSQQHAEQARRAALETYRSRNYVGAIAAFEKSRQACAENRIDSLGLALCRCYMAWTDLDLSRLEEGLRSLNGLTSEPRMKELLRDRLPDRDRYARHIQALDAVARGESLALTATFLELAALYQAAQRHDFACLLIYRSMEALVELGLKKFAGEAFNRAAPDYSLLGDSQDLERRFADLTEKVGGRSQQPLPEKVSFLNGLHLLCLVDQVHARLERPMSDVSLIKRYRSEAERRNSSVLAHGTRTLTASDSQASSLRAEELAQAILHHDGHQELLVRRADLAPLALELMDDPRV